MVEVTNRALGPRILYVKGADGAPVPRTLARGETADVELHRGPKDDPILGAWVDAQEIIIGPVPGAPGQPSHEELMAAWQEKQAREAAGTTQLAPQGIGEQPSGADTSRQDGGAGDTTGAPNLETMSDDDLRAFLVAREVTPGNWQRARLVKEAEAVKDVAPIKAA
ncbi:hypothetical protein [Methylobacterium tarhaniae]|uniref:hypothetical protein n=1 Tax=Methylobacterium tarhaniae TaxID=1187852 RepID=UPI003CFF8387